MVGSAASPRAGRSWSQPSHPATQPDLVNMTIDNGVSEAFGRLAVACCSLHVEVQIVPRKTIKNQLNSTRKAEHNARIALIKI